MVLYASISVKAAAEWVTKPSRGTDDYYYSLLLLFLPHKSSHDIVAPYENAKDAFKNKFELFDKDAIDVGYKQPELEAIIQSIQLANIETNFVAPNCAENNTQPLIEENLSSKTTEPVNVEISNTTVLQNTQNLYCSEIVDAQKNESSWHEISSGASGADFLQPFSLLTRDQKCFSICVWYV